MFPGHNEPSFIAETSFVRAPLNSRVSSIGAAPKTKGKAKQESLGRVPLDIQEAMILEDLLYVLMVRPYMYDIVQSRMTK
jgi:gamma-tubulin complex component 2